MATRSPDDMSPRDARNSLCLPRRSSQEKLPNLGIIDTTTQIRILTNQSIPCRECRAALKREGLPVEKDCSGEQEVVNSCNVKTPMQLLCGPDVRARWIHASHQTVECSGERHIGDEEAASFLMYATTETASPTTAGLTRPSVPSVPSVPSRPRRPWLSQERQAMHVVSIGNVNAIHYKPRRNVLLRLRNRYLRLFMLACWAFAAHARMVGTTAARSFGRTHWGSMRKRPRTQNG